MPDCMVFAIPLLANHGVSRRCTKMSNAVIESQTNAVASTLFSDSWLVQSACPMIFDVPRDPAIKPTVAGSTSMTYGASSLLP